MSRLFLIAWLCAGAFGLGLVFLEAIRRKRSIHPGWTLLALGLGPLFLFFVLPLWLGRWGREDRKVRNPEKYP